MKKTLLHNMLLEQLQMWFDNHNISTRINSTHILLPYGVSYAFHGDNTIQALYIIINKISHGISNIDHIATMANLMLTDYKRQVLADPCNQVAANDDVPLMDLQLYALTPQQVRKILDIVDNK